MSNIYSREVVIDGKRVSYDAMSALPYKMALDAYGKRYQYIGESSVLYVNGVKSESKSSYHFFIKRNTDVVK